MPYEIERKYIVNNLPDDYASFPHLDLEQGYLNLNPTVRIRKENDTYYLTYKNGSNLVREEYNLSLDQPSYEHMREKCDGNLIKKKRYQIPLHEPNYKEVLLPEDKSPSLVIELDVFEDSLSPLIYAEIEFASEKEANAFIPPSWFGREVTSDYHYTNALLSRNGIPADF